MLTFEFGLLWPRFMGQWGDAFGVPFAFEGMFFFTEAIFISIYIFGWRRLRPWPHFWTGVPIVLAGICGSALGRRGQRVDERARPGSRSNSAGEVVDVDPLAVIFNDAMPLQALHMLVAAYLVGGFLVASVYAVGMLRGRRDRYHRLGFIIPFTVAAIATPIQMAVGDTLARWVYNNEPIKFAAIELVPKTDERRARDAARAAERRRDGHRRDPDPGPRVVAVGPEHGHEHRHPGSRHRSRPTSGRPLAR